MYRKLDYSDGLQAIVNRTDNLHQIEYRNDSESLADRRSSCFWLMAPCLFVAQMICVLLIQAIILAILGQGVLGYKRSSSTYKFP